MLDGDLAELYGVETKQLKDRLGEISDGFPEDFMFQLEPYEYPYSGSQNGTLNQGENIKYAPMVFTEQGVAMLSSVLTSERAIKVNTGIMRIFTKVRKILADNSDLRLEIEKIKSRLDNQDKNTQAVFRYLDELIAQKNSVYPAKE